MALWTKRDSVREWRKALLKDVENASAILEKIHGNVPAKIKLDFIRALREESEESLRKAKDRSHKLKEIIEQQIEGLVDYGKFRSQIGEEDIEILGILRTQKETLSAEQRLIRQESVRLEQQAASHQEAAAVLELYHELFSGTVEEAHIGNWVFESLEQEVEGERARVDFFSHVKQNYEKQLALASVISQLADNGNYLISEDQEHQFFEHLTQLIEEEKKYAALLLRDEQMFVGLRNKILDWLQRKNIRKTKRKIRTRATILGSIALGATSLGGFLAVFALDLLIHEFKRELPHHIPALAETARIEERKQLLLGTEQELDFTVGEFVDRLDDGDREYWRRLTRDIEARHPEATISQATELVATRLVREYFEEIVRLYEQKFGSETPLAPDNEVQQQFMEAIGYAIEEYERFIAGQLKIYGQEDGLNSQNDLQEFMEGLDNFLSRFSPGNSSGPSVAEQLQALNQFLTQADAERLAEWREGSWILNTYYETADSTIEWIKNPENLRGFIESIYDKGEQVLASSLSKKTGMSQRNATITLQTVFAVTAFVIVTLFILQFFRIGRLIRPLGKYELEAIRKAYMDAIEK